MPAVEAKDGDRDVALEAVQLGCRVSGEMRVEAGVAEHHRFMVLADLVADRGFKRQLPAGLEPEIDKVVNGAGGPAILGDSRNCGKAQPGRARDDLQDHGHGVDAANCFDIRGYRRIQLH